MFAAAAEGKFEALIVRDLDRLSRNDEELPSLIYSLRDSGVAVWSYADKTRVDTRTAMSRGMLTMKATFAAAEREASQERTREALRRKAERGEVAGGRVLGYDNVRQGDGGPVIRVVNEGEAAIVRRIFEMAAGGKGLLRTAKALNAEGIKNPTGQDRGKPTKRSDQWSSTGIRDILHRELYRGVVVYGKTRNEYRKGKRIAIAGDAQIKLDRPALRIVSDELWQAAHERMEATHAVYLRRTGGRLNGKPASGLESRYLLAGFLRCGICGGNLIVSKRTGKRGRPCSAYICTTHKTRGDVACANRWGVPVNEITDGVLTSLKQAFLQETVFMDLLNGMAAAHRDKPESLAAQRDALTERIAALDAELKRLADAVAGGAAPKAILDAITAREQERRDSVAKLEHLNGLAIEGSDLVTLSITNMKELREELEGEPAVARQSLRRLLMGPIVVTPKLDAEGALLTFDFAGTATYAVLADEAWRQETRALSGTIPRHVQQVWPRGDSNTRHAV